MQNVVRGYQSGWLAPLALALVTVLLGVVAGNAAAAAPKKQVTLKFLVSSFAQDLDPDGVPTIPQAQIFPNVYDRYFWYPTTLKNGAYIANYKADQLSLVSHLVSSYSRAGNTWTFALRKGVKGCTGNELTADDAVYTFARAKSRTGVVNATFSVYSQAAIFDPKDTNKSLAGEIAKVSKYVFKVRTLHAAKGMPRLFADNSFGGIYDSKLLQSHATADDPWSHRWLVAGNAAGFGPYCLAGIDPTVQQYVLKANPGWYGEPPQFKYVIIRAVPDAGSRLQAVQTGAVDGANDLAPEQYASLAKTHSVITAFDSGILRMTLNFKSAPWGLPGNGYLRRAVAAAIDYARILATLPGAAARIQGQFAPTWFGAVTFPQPAQSLTLAKDLLAKAGFPDGKGLEAYKDGLTLYTSEANSAWAPAVANQIATALARIGIPITVAQLPAATFTTRSNRVGDLPMWIVAGNPGNTPEVSTAAKTFYLSRAAGGAANGSNYASPDVDRLIAAMDTAEGADNKALAVQLQKALWGDLPVVPIARFAYQAAFKKGITGWLVCPVGPVMSFWTLRSS